MNCISIKKEVSEMSPDPSYLQEKEATRSKKSNGMVTGAGVYGGEAQSLSFPMMIMQFDRRVLVWGSRAEMTNNVSSSKYPIFFFEDTPHPHSLGHDEDTHSCYFSSES